jgi:hypothetical protein
MERDGAGEINADEDVRVPAGREASATSRLLGIPPILRLSLRNGWGTVRGLVEVCCEPGSQVRGTKGTRFIARPAPDFIVAGNAGMRGINIEAGRLFAEN